MKRGVGTVKSRRLKKLEKNQQIIEKSKRYLEGELSRIREREEELGKKIRTERQAIALSNKAKKLRSKKNK